MEFLDTIRSFIKNSEDNDLYKYLALFFGGLFLILGILGYFHFSRVRWYQNELKKVDSLRSQTQKLLRDYKIVTAQKEKVEEILAQNKDFRIGEAYQSIIQKVGLGFKLQDQSAPTTGETVSGKTEVQISSHFAGITMKQLTDLLSEIANVPQLFIKELTIKKSPTMPTVDLDITVATLEHESAE